MRSLTPPIKQQNTTTQCVGDFDAHQSWNVQQKAMWKDRCTKLHDPNNTSFPTADVADADIANCYANPQDFLAADRQLYSIALSRRSSNSNERTTHVGSSAHAAPIVAFCKAPQSALLQPISSHSCTHIDPHIIRAP